MRTLRLNGLMMSNRERAHRHLKKRLRLPDYYGANLDALCDCLGEMNEGATIRLTHARAMRRRLGEYGVKLLSVLAAATGENPMLSLDVREGW